MITPHGFISPQVRPITITPLDQVHSQPAMSLVPESYVLLDGNPTVPLVSVRAKTLLSAEGVYYVERPSILDIHPDALVRFVATDDSWSTISYVWSATQSGTLTRYQMNGSPLSSPVLIENDYQIGREYFTAQALSFDTDTVLTSDFDSGHDDAYSFTIAMAINPIDVDGQLLTFLDGSYVRLTDSGLEAKVADQVFSVDIPQGSLDATPLYVILDVAPPVATLMAGISPSRIYQGSSPVAERTTSFVFTVSGSMDLYSLDIWGTPRPPATEIVARYATVLGSN